MQQRESLPTSTDVSRFQDHGESLPLLCIVDPSPGLTGALIAARRQAELLADMARCVLVLRDDAAISAEQLRSFEQVIRLPIRPLQRSVASAVTYPLAVLRSGRLLARFLKRTGCTRLQINDYYLLDGAVARGLGYRGRLATWIRIDPEHYGRAVAPVWLAAARMVSDRIVAVSEFIRSRLQDRTNPLLLYDPAPSLDLAAPPRQQRFVFIGNYVDGKGQDLAIRAFHHVAVEYSNAELICYGGELSVPRNERFRAFLQQLAAAGPGAARIHLRDFADDTGAVLDGALAALNLSRSESFSLACQEASSRGVAVIATRSGGPQEIIDHGTTGWLVDVDDEHGVANAMRAALRDPGRTSAMGRRGAQLILQRFSTEAFRAGLADLFDLPLPSRSPLSDARSNGRDQ